MIEASRESLVKAIWIYSNVHRKRNTSTELIGNGTESNFFLFSLRKRTFRCCIHEQHILPEFFNQFLENFLEIRGSKHTEKNSYLRLTDFNPLLASEISRPYLVYLLLPYCFLSAVHAKI